MMKSLLRLSLLFASVFLLFTSKAVAGPGDTTEVQIFTFGSAQDTAVYMPADSLRFERIWLYYRLKCVPGNNPSCGEWDYLTYTNIYDSTGVLDSTLLTHPNYLLGNQSPANYSYTLTPTWTYNQFYQYFIVYDNVVSETPHTLGSGAVTAAHPFTSSNQDVKSQYLFTAAELTGAGVTPGLIHSVAFNLSSLGSNLEYLTVRLKASSLTALNSSSYESGGFTTVYEYNTAFSATGFQRLNFTTPFNWDGTSNLVMEISYDKDANGSNTVVMADNITDRGVTTAGPDHFLNFNGPDYVTVPDNGLAALDSFVTVSFWQYGDPAIQPQNNWTFEGVDAQNRRVINVHLPWSDATVYWDCGNGNSASYDRISKPASTANFEGQWNHWAFTKNVATGSMKIYLNGALWHSGTSLTRYLSPIKTFRIGSSWNNGGNYDGYIDEFQVWNAELDAATIAAWMNKDVTPAHPNYSDLLLYHKYNEASGNLAADASPNNNDGTNFGMAAPTPLGGPDLFRNFTNTTSRPQVRFIQGTYTTHLDSTLVTDSVMNAPVSITYFSDSLNATTATDTVIGWPANVYTYTYGPDGSATDSTFVNADTSITRVDWPYWSAPFEVIDRYEIHRFITPYGIGLDLGADGWLWKVDVTDYRPLFKGLKRFTAGNWQELLDMKLVFVEGTPVRDPLTVENIWQGDFALSSFATTVAPQTVLMNPAASQYRLKTRATGHQFSNPTNCAEFCYKIHSVKVNNFQIRSWQIMEECAENPLFPQGGTWIYDRAGWCPGKEGTTYDTEITSSVTPGQTAVLDYESVSDPYGNYVFEGQLISYGPTNHTLDAAVEDIVAPNNYEMHNKYNPICGKPIIKIRNGGSTVITSLVITYGIEGSTLATYNWTGTLDFQEVETVELPLFNWGNGNTFIATVSAPNGGTDQYAFNDTQRSQFATPPVYPGTFAVYMRTNNAGGETTWKIYDDAGNIMYQNTIFIGPNTTFVDTVSFPVGCYNLKISDTGQDGLDFFANNDGTGFFRLRNMSGTYFRTFETDFGKWQQQNFTVTDGVAVDPRSQVEPGIEVFPNPSTGVFTLEIAGRRYEPLQVEVMNQVGQVVWRETMTPSQNVEHFQVNLGEVPSGLYFVNVKGNGGSLTEKITVTK